MQQCQIILSAQNYGSMFLVHICVTAKLSLERRDSNPRPNGSESFALTNSRSLEYVWIDFTTRFLNIEALKRYEKELIKKIEIESLFPS